MYYRNEVSIIGESFKTYDHFELNLIKPITVIAGPNGEGKSNLLEGILISVSEFIERSTKFRNSSFFTQKIPISRNPKILTSYFDLVFKDLVQKALFHRPTQIGHPERLKSKNLIRFGEDSAWLDFTVEKHYRNTHSTIGFNDVWFDHHEKDYSRVNHDDYINRIDALELFYIPPSDLINNFFVKLTAWEFTNQINSVRGNRNKTSFIEKILGKHLDEKDRLIHDIEDGLFQESSHKETELFLTDSLATGAKKECFLYMLGLLEKKMQGKKDWLAIFIIDEFEAGLNVNRQKKLVDALTSLLDSNESLSKHVKFIITTHSPIIYSELGKHETLTEVKYVLRNPETSLSEIFDYDETVNDPLLEKRVLTELGLNIYDLPKKVVFVEGKTDVLLFSNVLDDCVVFPFRGGSLPNILKDFITSFPHISRIKDYVVVGDKSAKAKITSDVNKLSKVVDSISLECLILKYDSLEELIFNVDLSSDKPAEIWSQIGKSFKRFERVLGSSLRELKIDVEKEKLRYEKRGINGVKQFFKTLKGKDDFYSLLGSKWNKLLEAESKEEVTRIIESGS